VEHVPPPGPGVPGAPPPENASWQTPADYYATPPPPERKGCPKWVPISCGAAGCLALIVILVGGYFLMRGGATWMIDFALTRIDRDAERMMTPEVTAEQKDEFRVEFSRLRVNLGAGRVPMTETQRILSELQSSISDRSLTPDEVEELTDTMRQINAAAERGVQDEEEEPDASSV
jgi:hypothetical protein